MDGTTAATAGTATPPRKAARAEPPAENPDSRYCNYYVARKHRFCKTERRLGSVYCPTHSLDAKAPVATGSTAGDTPGEDVRVPCPINPNHTVYASRLAKHVKVCPDLRFVTTDLPYYSADVHADRGVPHLCCAPSPGTARFTHRSLSADERSALQQKIKQCYEQRVRESIIDLRAFASAGRSALVGCDSPRGDSSSDTEADPEEADPEEAEVSVSGSTDGTQPKSRKHSPQHSALLQCLQYALSQSSGCPQVDGFIELGAGKGGLSVALQGLLMQYADAKREPAKGAEVQQLEAAFSFLPRVVASPQVVVVDMDGFRRTGDARVRRTALPLHRLRINIKDLDLAVALRHSFPTPQDTRWVALGKHLCGACTDFALAAVAAANGEAPSTLYRVPVLVIATCCHHRCELRHVNPPSNCGEDSKGNGVTLPGTPSFTFTEKEFAAMTSMTSWAVCGDFVDASQREVGYQCKRVIDELRVAFLKSKGFTAAQCRYTSTDVTGENVCLLAWQ